MASGGRNMTSNWWKDICSIKVYLAHYLVGFPLRWHKRWRNEGKKTFGIIHDLVQHLLKIPFVCYFKLL